LIPQVEKGALKKEIDDLMAAGESNGAKPGN
jgi:hypothetical protein